MRVYISYMYIGTTVELFLLINYTISYSQTPEKFPETHVSSLYGILQRGIQEGAKGV